MTINEDAIDLLTGHRLALLRYEAGTTQAMLAAYDAALADVTTELAALSARIKAGTSTNRRGLDRLRTVRDNLTREIVALQRTATATMQERLEEAAEAEAAFHAREISRTIGISLTEVPEETVAFAVNAPLGSGRWQDRLNADLLQVHDGVQSALARGLASGASNDKIARMIRTTTALVETYRGRFVSIARTETQRVANDVAMASYAENDDVIGAVQYLATLDSRTCLLCAPLHNRVYPLVGGEAQGLERVPPLHARCFVGDTMVSGALPRGATSRWYVGDVVEVRTVSGAVFTVTPNHPMLTTNGWVAAGLLDEGTHVLRCLDLEGVAGLDNPDDYQRPTRIEDVARALVASPTMVTRRVPASPEYFHGDGAGGDVHVVGPDSLLNGGHDPHSGQPSLQSHFRRRHMEATAFHRGGVLQLRGQRDGAATRGGVGSLGVPAVLLGGSQRGRGAVGGRQVTQGDAGRDQPLVHLCAAHAEELGARVLGQAAGVGWDDLGGHHLAGGRSRSAPLGVPEGFGRRPVTPDADALEMVAKAVCAQVELGGGGLARLAKHVSPDRVVKVLRRSFEGHVYNLDTGVGWYVANGIISHNCRCFMAPVTRSWADLGIRPRKGARGDYDGEPATETTFDAWLRRQPVDTQDDILGETRRKLWARGAVTLEKFAPDGRVLNLGELRARYATV